MPPGEEIPEQRRQSQAPLGGGQTKDKRQQPQAAERDISHKRQKETLQLEIKSLMRMAEH